MLLTGLWLLAALMSIGQNTVLAGNTHGQHEYMHSEHDSTMQKGVSMTTRPDQQRPLLPVLDDQAGPAEPFAVPCPTQLDVPLRMELWTGKDSDEDPTWHLEVTGCKPDDVLILAKRGWQWASREKRAFSTNKPFALVVAGLWNPFTKKVFLSTVPRGVRAEEMWKRATQEPDKRGPLQPKAWITAAKAYKESKQYYCAEDGVLFNAETNAADSKEPGNGIDKDKSEYPEGAFVSVWSGTRTGPTDKDIPEEPKQILPCAFKRDLLDIPGCKTTLDNLGVRHGLRTSGGLDLPMQMESYEHHTHVGAERVLEQVTLTTTQLRFRQRSPPVDAAALRAALKTWYDQLSRVMGLMQ